MARKDSGLPPHAGGTGDWYHTPRTLEHVCVRCGNRHPEAPGVLEYLPDMDRDGSQRAEHPDWPMTGWLAWWHCPHCERDQYVAVTTAQVAIWGRELGGWRQ
jgi:hypothetical protein